MRNIVGALTTYLEVQISWDDDDAILIEINNLLESESRVISLFDIREFQIANLHIRSAAQTEICKVIYMYSRYVY